MHVLVLSPWYPNPTHPLEGSFVQTQARALRRAGLLVRVFHPRVDYARLGKVWRPGLAFEADREVPGLTCFRVESPFLPRRGAWLTGRWSRFVAGFFPRYTERFGPPDLIHAHTALGALVARELRQQYGIPYVVSLHESALLKGGIPEHRKPVLAQALAESGQVLAVSRTLAQAARQTFGLPAVSCLPNFIETRAFTPAPEPPAAPPFRFVAIGDLIEGKRFDLLLEALASLHRAAPGNFRLHLAGYGATRRALERQVRAEDLGGVVTFRGLLEEREVAQLLRASHALVLSSEAETFGIVLAEAMASGLPVVATDCGGPADLVTPETGILVPPGDAKALAKAMHRVAETYQAFDRQAIRRHVMEHFSEEAVIPKWIKVYEASLRKP